MCGIAGLIATSAQLARRALPPMVRALAHRGPDDSGEAYLPFGSRCLALGHRRLSIIDLSSAGHQPMVHPRTGDQLVFNGEIYNFPDLRTGLEAEGDTFEGHCDTEVLLHGLSRYGTAFLDRLEGMYAFGFYNARESSLLLARDPLGIKPLYTARAAGAVLFASEVRGLLASGLVSDRLDRRGLASLLAYGAVQQPLALFHDVSCFMPGTFQKFTVDGDATGDPPRRFWQFPTPQPIAPEEATARLDGAMTGAVRRHLISDVPLGVFLSSGLDSTIVAGLAAEHTRHLRTFTVAFSDQEDFSELELARETAQIFGLEHTEVRLDGPDATAALGEWLLALDQPSVDGLNTFIISRAVRREGIVVALSGLGGDELFGGYSSFADVPKLNGVLSKISFMPPALRVALGKLITLRRSRSVRDKMSDIMRTDFSLLALYLQRRRLCSDDQLDSLGLPRSDLAPGYVPYDALESLRLDPNDPVWTVSELESAFYQGNMLLRDSDVTGMAHGLEIRVPMLDRGVAEFAHSLPGRARLIPGAWNKQLLRSTFPRFLRADLLAQGKRGFALPIRRWMTGPIRELCEDGLNSLKAHGVVPPAGVDAIWNAYLAAPESPIWSRAFMLVVLGFYLKRVHSREC